MKKFTDQLMEHMEQELHGLRMKEADDLRCYEQSFLIVKKCLAALKTFILGYTFKNEQEEIRFFKGIKPAFQKELIFYFEAMRIEVHRPIGCSRKKLVAYYDGVSARLLELFTRQQTLYRYYRIQSSGEDSNFFLRDASMDAVGMEDALDLDNRFSTYAGSNLARIMAHEMLLEHLSRLISEAEQHGQQSPGTLSAAYWTGSKVALTELAYGIHCSGAVNHGKGHIKQVVEALELGFNIKVGNFYRSFQNMRIRLGESRSPFIDGMRVNLQKYMDDTDLGYKP